MTTLLFEKPGTFALRQFEGVVKQPLDLWPACDSGCMRHRMLRSLRGILNKFPVKPGLREFDLPMNCGSGDPQRVGGFVIGHPAEVKQLHDFAFTRVVLCQPVERLVQFDDNGGCFWTHDNCFIQLYLLCSSTVFLTIVL